MKIGIVGWGIEGQSALRYFGEEHDYLIVNEHARDDFPAQSDKIKIQFLNTPKPLGITSSTEDLSYMTGIDACDRIIYSVTSYHNLKKAFGDDQAFWAKATTVMKIFFEESPTRNIIGVTGTKGKSTTTTLIHQMLQAAGVTAHIGGNIGTSVLDLLSKVQADDWVVLEMSSYQLNNFPYSPRVAVCLQISPEHLDWHEDIDNYVEAKTNIFSHQKPEDIAIYFADNEKSTSVAGSSPGTKIPYFSQPGARLSDAETVVIGEPPVEIIKKSEIKLLGDHNLQNICAALTAFWFGVAATDDQTRAAAAHKLLSNFAGLEHRLELVRELDGVKYYDDSFGTLPETAIVAMQALPQPKVMIIGGYDRGIDMEPLVEELMKQRLRHVVVIGQTGPQVADMLDRRGFHNVTVGLNNMKAVVKVCHEKAQPGDVVLLSAAAASFDMFRDFVDRGNQFKEAVNAL